MSLHETEIKLKQEYAPSLKRSIFRRTVQCGFVNIVITGGSSGAVLLDSVDDNVPAGIPSGEEEEDSSLKHHIALGLWHGFQTVQSAVCLVSESVCSVCLCILCVCPILAFVFCVFEYACCMKCLLHDVDYTVSTTLRLLLDVYYMMSNS